MKKIYAILTIVLLLHLSLASPAAASSLNLSIDPPLLRVQIKPGKSITKAYTIENKSDQDQLLVARIVPFNKSDFTGNPILDLKNNYNWLSYFSLSNTDVELNKPFTVKAGNKQQLVISLSVPETAPLMDIYASLLVSTYSNTLPSEQKGTLVSATIGSNLLVTITSELNPKTLLKIDNITPHGGTFFKFGNIYIVDNLSPLTFTALANNIGDFTAEIRGLFKILKNKQPVIMQGILPQYVIAKSSRSITPAKGNVFYFTPQINHLGFYQASFEIQTENVTSQNSINLFLFPFKALFGILIGLILLKLVVKKP